MPVFDKVSQNIMNFSTNQNLKKSLEEKNQEKIKIYSYIGMEAYDLYKAGKLKQQDLEIHFEKLKTLDQEIAEMNNKVAQSVAGAGKITCSCGNVVNAKMKFCPQCGKAVETMITCSICGKQVKNDMKFCPQCGNQIKAILEETVEGNVQSIQKFRECICGAKVPEGQTICMECGRRVGE